MKQTFTETLTPEAARPRIAWFSAAIPEVVWPDGHRGRPENSRPCPANPISGQDSPIMDQRLASARERRVAELRHMPFPRQSPGRKSAMRKSTALNLARVVPTGRLEAPPRPTAAIIHLKAPLHLPPGEALDSLLAVHRILGAELSKRELAVYEAGGGSTSFLPADLLRRSAITVVDIDEEQLRNNDYAQETILGDIQIHRFAPNSFDLVTCYNVIEHLPDVEAALTGFFHALKPGGLVMIAAPNPESLSGVVTRYTPHWFHVWFYRHVLGKKRAGLPGQAPFPTFFHPLVRPEKLIAFAEAQGMQVIYRKEHESPRYPEMRARTPRFAALLDAFATMTNLVLSPGSDVRRGDYHLILRKR
jgi:2-polyprenyl-3-methyl-5-hydroxy-6-metoxy-1,4-benzoquinol methylase